VHPKGDTEAGDENLSAGTQREASEESPTQLTEDVAPVRLSSPWVLGLDTMVNDEAGVAVDGEEEEAEKDDAHKTTKERRRRDLRKA
jgi:hypothetical protein